MEAQPIAQLSADVIQSLRWDREDAMPKMGSREIAADIAGRIYRRDWGPGDKLPTSKEFAAEYDVDERTIDYAFERLVDNKLVRGVRGGGRYVAYVG